MIDGPQRVRAVLQLFLLTSTASKALRTPLATPGTDLALNELTASQLRFFIHMRFKETAMHWITPAYTDLRFGFEITMYIANR